MYFCPTCNGRMIQTGRSMIVLPILNTVRMGVGLQCTNCAAFTEVDPTTGDLLEFPARMIQQLYVPYNSIDARHTPRSLLSISHLHLGRES